MLNITESEISNYVKYIHFIQSKLDKFFEAQKPYIFCKKGCSKCCHKQSFPYSQMEMAFLLRGGIQLSPDKQEIIDNNIQKLMIEKQNFKGKKFRYDCPFLIDDICSVYDYRGFICRSFGLMIKLENDKTGVPFCCFDGLNYANVINKKTKKVSERKYKQLKVDCTPNRYNVSYSTLVDDDLAKGFGFSFGERKTMAEWLEIAQKMNS